MNQDVNRKPNIVIFNPDQYRGDVLAHIGNPAAVTPNLDRFATEDGVSFRNAFCQSPICTASRCSFMSGWYPHTRGHRTMLHMMHKDEPVLLKTLKDNGYYVWWGGKNDLVPAQDGFGDYCTVKYEPAESPGAKHTIDTMDRRRGSMDSDTYYSFFVGKLDHTPGYDRNADDDWALVDGALEMIRNYKGDKPFCLYLPLSYPHPPYAIDEPWFSMIDRELIPKRIAQLPDEAGKPAAIAHIAKEQGMQGWSEDRWTELRAVYYGMCARIDHQFGLVVSALKEAGLYDDTAMFFFSDHGDFTGDYGVVQKFNNQMCDVLSRVPFLVKPPANHAVKPRVSDALVELVDLPATVFEMTGIKPDYHQFGKSLLPVLKGESDEHRDAVFCQGGRLKGESLNDVFEFQKRGKTSEYWTTNVVCTSDDNATHGPASGKATMCRTREYKYVHRLFEADELYDLKSDPGETQNRIDDPTLATVQAQFKDRTMRFYLETSDVLPLNQDQRERPTAR